MVVLDEEEEVVVWLVGGIGIWGMGPREAVEVILYVIYCMDCIYCS